MDKWPQKGGNEKGEGGGKGVENSQKVFTELIDAPSYEITRECYLPFG